MGGRDRRVVHVDRLQRCDMAVLDDINFTSHPRSEDNKLTRQPSPDGDNLRNQPKFEVVRQHFDQSAITYYRSRGDVGGDWTASATAG